MNKCCLTSFQQLFVYIMERKIKTNPNNTSPWEQFPNTIELKEAKSIFAELSIYRYTWSRNAGCLAEKQQIQIYHSLV